MYRSSVFETFLNLNAFIVQVYFICNIDLKNCIQGDANSSVGIQSAEGRRCPINSYKLTVCTGACNGPGVMTDTNVNSVKPDVPVPSLNSPTFDS